jgi:TM2 domain-containing membrane protein YozV
MEDKQINLAKKAALLNALLFPGWGEIYLKKYVRGILIIAAVLAGMISILYSIIQATVKILKIAPFKKGTVTLMGVVQLAADAIKSLNLSYLFLLFFSILLLWIASIVDAYYLGKQQMAGTDSATPSPSTETVPPEESL